MRIAYRKSSNILSNNITWLLSSDIRIKSGRDKGALFGWKNLKPVSFPFIYSEITGYAITCLLWIYTVLNNTDALQAAKESSVWIIKNMKNHILDARPSISNKLDGSGSQYYAYIILACFMDRECSPGPSVTI